jgi:hypothetical protein
VAANNPEDIAARVARVSQVYVSTPKIDEAFEVIKNTRTMRRKNGGAFASLITGVSGMGKTSIFETYEAEEPVPTNDQTMPVLLMSTPSPFSMTAFWETMLAKLGAPAAQGRARVDQLVEMVHLWLDRRGVQLILLEEVSHIVDRKARDAKIPYFVTDAIKLHLLDTAKVPVVMNGIPVAAELFRINPQLKMRRLEMVELLPYDLKDLASKKQFMLLLEVFEVVADFPQAHLANNEWLCDRVHWATGGVHGSMATLLMVATRIAAERGADGFGRDILALACAKCADPEDGWFLLDKLPAEKVPDESRVTKLHKGKRRDEGKAA